jgi:glycosyltransferase involved in cell wall biosynthesis
MPSDHIEFCIITPTFERKTLLRRYLRRIGRQTRKDWQLLVVHDGPNCEIRSLVERYGKHDTRISYLETALRADDCGATPRLQALNHLLAHPPVPAYVVFWDDDNSYAIDALERIANALEAAHRPDLLLMSVRRGSQTIPPADIPIRSLQVGQLDTASLIFRPDLARDAYASILGRCNREEILQFNDFLTYRYVNQLFPPRSIERDIGDPVCQHDGARWGPYIRSALAIPPLGLAKLLGLGR